jgi:hypothetical protein
MSLNITQQKELNNLLLEQEKIQSRITAGQKLYKPTLERQEKITTRIIELKKIENELTLEQKDLHKDIQKLYGDLEKKQKKLNTTGQDFFGMKNKQLNVEKALLDTISMTVDKEKDPAKLNILKSQHSFIADIQDGSIDITALKTKQLELDSQIQELSPEDGMVGILTTSKEVYGTKEKQLKTDNAISAAMDGVDSLTGGMVSKFKGMGLSSGLMAAGIGAAVMILIEFSGKMDAIGASFGAVLNYGNELQTNLLASEQDATRLGKSLEDVVESTKTLSNDFGYSQAEAAKLSSGIIDTSVALGISVGEASNFVGIMSTIGGLTAQTSQDLAKQVFLLAQVEGVAPQAVLADIAASAEDVAKFTDGSGTNIARAAMQARKFGMSLSTVASSAEGLLDYSSSLQNALTASVITGKQFNIQKLQELALGNDLEGVQREQYKILKDIGFAELDNVIAKRAAADALGLSVENAAKMVSKTEEAITLAGQLSGQQGFDELIGTDGISTLTQMSGLFKSIGATLVNGLGPALNLVLRLIMAIVGAIEVLWEGIGLGALFRVLGGQSADYTEGVSRGFNTMAGSVGLADGGVVSATPGGMSATVAEGGESELVTPLSKVGSLVEIDLDPVLGALATLVGEIKSMKNEVVRGNNKQLSTVISNKQLKIIQTDANGSFG